MGWLNQWMHCNLYRFKIFCNCYLIVPKPLIAMKRQNRIKHESTNISCKTYGGTQRWPCEDFVTCWIVFFIFFLPNQFHVGLYVISIDFFKKLSSNRSYLPPRTPTMENISNVIRQFFFWDAIFSSSPILAKGRTLHFLDGLQIGFDAFRFKFLLLNKRIA
jgi:hypothetical protein